MHGPAAVALAQRLLPDTSSVYRDVLQARIDHPDESLAQIADRLGWTKNTCATRLRRALTGARPRNNTLGRKASDIYTHLGAPVRLTLTRSDIERALREAYQAGWHARSASVWDASETEDEAVERLAQEVTTA
jgi:hypothetical protein